ncbi:MAG: hypothetical protein KGH98_02865 [Candidatus Micrarchaeota archaeon]|nr:hypothetical protein [Candidatus Micrarchaeota archaeon]
MVLLYDMRHAASFLSGVAVGGALMMYLLTLPSVVGISSMNVSQAYSLVVLGIVFFSANVGMIVGLFVKGVVSGNILKA